MEQFLKNLILEYQVIAEGLALSTIFFGGGTPTALSAEMLQRLFSKKFCIGEYVEQEVTMECNPSTLSIQKADIIFSSGVNRLSIGAQSFDPCVLKVLGRTHSVSSIIQCLNTAREAGFTNINLDLIFGVPSQTLASWETTLEMALSLKPQHLSCYGLTYEEDTDFFLRHQQGELKKNVLLESQMFGLADKILTKAGFHHYEISNYALAGFESRHNLGYWRGEDYYGIGPSAVSTVCGKRYQNSRLSPDCAWNIKETEYLSPEVLASERMALGLRTREGIDENSFAQRFGFLPSERWKKEIQFLAQNGFLRTEPTLCLTAQGYKVADRIAEYFV